MVWCDAGTTMTHLTVWWYNVTTRWRTVWWCNWCYNEMLWRMYGGTMGKNVMDDMMTRLPKRLMINDGGSGSKLKFYLSNSFLLVVRDSTPECHEILDCMRSHAMLQRSHAIACNVTEIACDCMQCRCDCMQSHVMSCDLEKKPFCLWLSEFLKIHREQEAGLKVCPKSFFATTVNRFIIIIFFDFLKKEEMRSGTHFTQQTCFFQFPNNIWFHVYVENGVFHFL